VDEPSGTLRCSIADVPEATDLPFVCALDISEDPSQIAKAVLKAEYGEGIPMVELEEIPWIAPEADTTQFVLPVFARRLTSSC
jgi:hypothetical protein